MHAIEIVKADLDLGSHQRSVVALLNGYASDPMGNGKPLSAEVQSKLVDGLRNHPTTLVFLAMLKDEPVGIAATFRGFSTFAAKPLINIHDLFVVPALRGHGVAQLLLNSVEAEARLTGCCKLTLEVQENNSRAQHVYHAFGFARSIYVHEAGGSLFFTKPFDEPE